MFLHSLRVILPLLNIIGDLNKILHSNLIVIILAWIEIFAKFSFLVKRDLIVAILVFLHSLRGILLLLNIIGDMTGILHSKFIVITLTGIGK